VVTRLLKFYGSKVACVRSCLHVCLFGDSTSEYLLHCVQEMRNARFARRSATRSFYNGAAAALGVTANTLVCVGNGFVGSAVGRKRGRKVSKLTSCVKVCIKLAYGLHAVIRH